MAGCSKENKTADVLEKELDVIAKELHLTPLQKNFCDYYFFVTNRNALEAFDLSNYKVGTKRESFESDEMYEKYLKMEKTRKCTDLMNNPKIRKYITAINKAREEYIQVDKFWVINKLKQLADTAPENVQFNATKALGEHLDMFKKHVELSNDLQRPDKAMQEIWAERDRIEREKKRQEDKATEE